MIAVVGYLISLISLSTSLVDDFPILSQLNCAECPSVYAPVCTNGDLTFTNECRVQCFNDKLREQNRPLLHVIYYGTCVSTFVQIGVQVAGDVDIQDGTFL
ncbi:uncharacterized protein LOC134802763 [Cydia splendana]|uniref:uncharacterized protein LOC134802763 n=1 Tax=Cydia splendana TaxID=1100963 RepID=UPI0028F47025